MRESKFRTSVLLRALGICFSVLPPASAILCYFPVWVERGGEYTVSGIAALLLIVAFVPIMRLVKRAISSVSAHAVWLGIFIAFFLVSRIADEMVVISFVGFIGNLIGAALFKLGEWVKRNEG